jgi:hypothetical protein
MAVSGAPKRQRPGSAAGKKSTKGAPVAQTESLAANSFALYRVAPLIGLARDAFRIALLRSVIPEERHQAVPESLQHMPVKADHGLDISSR